MREDVMSVRRKHLSSIGYDNEQRTLCFFFLFFSPNLCVSSYQAKSNSQNIILIHTGLTSHIKKKKRKKFMDI